MIGKVHAVVHPVIQKVAPDVGQFVHAGANFIRGQSSFAMEQSSPTLTPKGQEMISGGSQKGVYYGTDPRTGETHRFDIGERPLDAQTRQKLHEAGWTNLSSTPPKGSDNWVWNQQQNTFVKRTTNQPAPQGGGWDSWLPW